MQTFLVKLTQSWTTLVFSRMASPETEVIQYKRTGNLGEGGGDVSESWQGGVD